MYGMHDIFFVNIWSCFGLFSTHYSCQGKFPDVIGDSDVHHIKISQQLLAYAQFGFLVDW